MIHNRVIESRANTLLLNNGINAPIIDVVRIANSLGIGVYYEPLENNISGMLSMSGGNNVIIYNRNHRRTPRWRFTVAHEIGHFILHRFSKDIFVDSTASQVLYRKDSRSNQNYKQESEANAFAAALLMPRQMILKSIKNKPLDLVSDNGLIKNLAKEFGVSQHAMSIRVSDLGIFY